MPKSAFLILFKIMTILVFSQNERHIKFLFEDVSEKKRSKFFKKLTKNQEKYWYNKYLNVAALDTSANRTIEDLKQDIFFIDLNNDTFPEVIDESGLGIAPVLIYLNCKDSFKLLINEPESHFKEIIKKGNEIEIITSQFGMVYCYQGESNYLLKNDSIELIKKRFRECCIGLPNKLYKKPKYFKTLVADSALREDTEIGKTQCDVDGIDERQTKKDNIIARFPKETQATVWGEYYNHLGQKWLFVEILLDEKDKLYRIGWMNADDLERSK
jgi:hypothetical protein